MAMNRLLATVDVDPRLDFMWRIQTDLQIKVLGCHPSELSDVDKMAFIREQAWALVSELNEAMNETGWKSWATSNHINREAYVSELGADAMRFLMNLMLVANVTPSEFFQSFVDKAATVMDRATNGYDGVSTKCPKCHRDLGDKGVECYGDEHCCSDHTRYWCDNVKGWFFADGRPM